MKTAISVEDELLEEADKTAREIGVSRSRLFSIAMESYLRERRNQAITDQLNEMYQDPPAAEEKQLLRAMKAKFTKVIKDDPW